MVSILATKNSATYANSDNKNARMPWWNIIIGVDVFLVIVSVLKKYYSDSEIIQWIGRPFNLAVEMNIAVWWSGLCLALLGLLSYELFSTSKKEERNAWLAMSILLLGLSLDEVGSLHERTGGWFNLLPYALICLALFGYAFIKLISIPEKRKSILLITSAFILYASVALQEYLEHLLNWPAWMIGIRLGIEEGTELFATLLIFFALVRQRVISSNSIEAVIPNPRKMKVLPIIVVLGILFEFAVFLAFPSLGRFSTKGNPLVWYPTVLFFILFCMAFWNFRCSESPYLSWKILSLIFILSSAAIMWNLLYFLPVMKDIIPGKGLGFLLYLVPVLIVGKMTLNKYGVRSYDKFIPIILSSITLIACLGYYVVFKGFDLAIWSQFSALYAVFMFFSLKQLGNIIEK